MKLNSHQFKRKSEYFLPFLTAFYFFNSGCLLVYKLDVTFFNGKRITRYVRSSNFSYSDVRSALVSSFDNLSFQTERQFFVSFLSSCNYRQLATFICLVRDTYSNHLDSIFSLFIKELPHMVGDNLYRAALDYANRK